MELTLKKPLNIFNWAWTRVTPKKATKEEKVYLISEDIVNKLFNDKFEKEKLTSEEIALSVLAILEKTKEGLVVRAENHRKELEEATKYHTFEIEEADKAFNRLL